MIREQQFSQRLPEWLFWTSQLYPWQIVQNLSQLITSELSKLGNDYEINAGLAIHRTATIEQGVVLKAPLIIGENCFLAAHAYLRGGVYLGNHVTVGPGCEIKRSVIGERSALAHFNFIGDSIIGGGVNFEAGAVIANHHNDRVDKEIFALVDAKVVPTGVQKFGALVGDDSKIGANSVLFPGTLLQANSIVGRLELVNQIR